MNLLRAGPDVAAELERELSVNRQVLLEGVELPESFMPPVANVAFIIVDSSPTIEVFMSAAPRYLGTSARWQAIDSGPTVGGYRLVTTCHGTGHDALALIQDLLRDADAADTAVSPILHDLGDEVRAGSRDLVERPDLLRQLVTCLLRYEKPGVLLVGQPGVGKTALVRLLTARIAAGEAPAPLRDLPIYELLLGRLLEQIRFVGELERRLRAVIERRGAIFFVDEVHQLARPELQPVVDLFKPALATGQLRLIAATTPVELRHIGDRAFLRRFTELHVPEPTPTETLAMIGPRVVTLGEHHRVAYAEEDLRSAIALAVRFVPRGAFPDKAIDILDLAGALQASSSSGRTPLPLAREHLLAAVADLAGLPPDLLDPERAGDLARRAARQIGEALIGQAAPIADLERVLTARVAERALALRPFVTTLEGMVETRPLACVLALGPTGVGKTESARLLAAGMFGGRLITLNGADVGPEAPHGVATWVGAPPGYVGFNQGGLLTDGLRAHAASGILVDEIEKASSQAIQNVLIPLLGAGVVTDRNTGEALSAAECVVFATSNIVVEAEGGEVRVATGDELYRTLRRYFRPEVIGRFHAVLQYRPLGMVEKWMVWEQQLARLVQQLGTEQSLTMDPGAQAWAAVRLDAVRTGARGVLDLFRDSVVPLVADDPQGSVLTQRNGALALRR